MVTSGGDALKFLVMSDNNKQKAQTHRPLSSPSTPPPPRSVRTPSPRRDLSEDVAHAIGMRIVSGRPAPGAQLPTEHQLCAEIGVSRAALREGFRLLAARGLIISRRKVGTIVRPISEWNMLDAWVLAWHLEQEPTAAFIDGLFEARAIVEPAAAAMAAARAEPAQLAAMEEAYAAMAAGQGAAPPDCPPEPQWEDLDLTIGADLRFHKAILAAAGNHFLASFGALIGSSLIVSFRLSWHAHQTPPGLALGQHAAVMQAIAARDAAQAGEEMRHLLRTAHEDARRALTCSKAVSPA